MDGQLHGALVKPNISVVHMSRLATRALFGSPPQIVPTKMPKGPRGERRPADAVGLAVLVGKIATGEVEDERDEKLTSAAAEMGRAGGKKRAENMTPERRREIAQKAAAKRWDKQA